MKAAFRSAILSMVIWLATTMGVSANDPAFWQWALTPPMGWNSYDAYGDSVTEAEFMANADYVKAHLLDHGYRYVVVDYRWYAGPDQPLTMDAFSRLMPEPNRFPSAANGAGFKPLADQVHAMGLKFGIHIMRGIPRQAVNAHTPLEGSIYTAADAGNPNDTCSWLDDMYGVDMTRPAGQDYYDSIFRLYASWGLDFVKVDDLSEPYHSAEIEGIRQAIDKCGRPIVFSLSPGATNVSHAAHVASQGNMWRVSWDGWDQWSDLSSFFDYGAVWQGVGGPGRWPDADMIPFGRIGIRSLYGDRWTRYTHDEQITLMSLFSLLPSPLILGNNLPDNDAATLALLTNDEVLAVNQDPLGQPGKRISQNGRTEVWSRKLQNGSLAVGLFNRDSSPALVTARWADLGITGSQTVRDLWASETLGSYEAKFQATLSAHGSMLLNITTHVDPFAAASPFPADGSSVLNVGSLVWTAGSRASSHRIYLGTTETLSLVSNQPVTSYNPGPLTVDSTYYWRVDEVRADGISTGDLWSFTVVSSLFNNLDIVKVGVPILPGSGSLSAGNYTITGAGGDIWDADDAFHFYERFWIGDGVLLARVNDLSNTNGWAKAGVMFRASLSSNASNAFLAITPGNGCTFQNRVISGGDSSYAATPGLATPSWVKLIRLGDTFTAYSSSDGLHWTATGSPTTVPMIGAIHAGLALTSHDASQSTTAHFDHVSFNLIAPTGLTATVLSDTEIQLNWNDHPGNSETAYTVERSPAGTNNWSILIDTLASHSAQYTDATASSATAYDFRVRCTNASLHSDYALASISTPAPLGDGIPGWWRRLHFGNGLTITSGLSGANDNPDSDELTNSQEFLASTDPLDHTSTLHIASLTRSGNNILISFLTVNGKHYLLEKTNNLITAHWSPIIDLTDNHTLADGTIIGDGALQHITDTAAAPFPHQFYHLKISDPPAGF